MPHHLCFSCLGNFEEDLLIGKLWHPKNPKIPEAQQFRSRQPLFANKRTAFPSFPQLLRFGDQETTPSTPLRLGGLERTGIACGKMMFPQANEDERI